ncbi:hypothetical protein M427DRAFT_408644 [Gonapodya prolifera JEL478]|uniref:Uncharacterized protein n=1 Tax=Gonapodya prolifera (strain JEL478) TaxID=1344416 RepID=A0A139A773_GONPJ|nr:hypothetical protein M427DRAFT_408644 [Gonapodya prolifera JEL478]|eukprot:KXS12193.1 hypothetical protein M427DRAFT_408644 [Gonapodya prolifera JEL478]
MTLKISIAGGIVDSDDSRGIGSTHGVAASKERQLSEHERDTAQRRDGADSQLEGIRNSGTSRVVEPPDSPRKSSNAVGPVKVVDPNASIDHRRSLLHSPPAPPPLLPPQRFIPLNISVLRLGMTTAKSLPSKESPDHGIVTTPSISNLDRHDGRALSAVLKDVYGDTKQNQKNGDVRTTITVQGVAESGTAETEQASSDKNRSAARTFSSVDFEKNHERPVWHLAINLPPPPPVPEYLPEVAPSDPIPLDTFSPQDYAARPPRHPSTTVPTAPVVSHVDFTVPEKRVVLFQRDVEVEEISDTEPEADVSTRPDSTSTPEKAHDLGEPKDKPSVTVIGNLKEGQQISSRPYKSTWRRLPAAAKTTDKQGSVPSNSPTVSLASTTTSSTSMGGHITPGTRRTSDPGVRRIVERETNPNHNNRASTETSAPRPVKMRSETSLKAAEINVTHTVAQTAEPRKGLMWRSPALDDDIVGALQLSTRPVPSPPLNLAITTVTSRHPSTPIDSTHGVLSDNSPPWDAPAPRSTTNVGTRRAASHSPRDFSGTESSKEPRRRQSQTPSPAQTSPSLGRSKPLTESQAPFQPGATVRRRRVAQQTDSTAVRSPSNNVASSPPPPSDFRRSSQESTGTKAKSDHATATSSAAPPPLPSAAPPPPPIRISAPVQTTSATATRSQEDRAKNVGWSNMAPSRAKVRAKTKSKKGSSDRVEEVSPKTVPSSPDTVTSTSQRPVTLPPASSFREEKATGVASNPEAIDHGASSQNLPPVEQRKSSSRARVDSVDQISIPSSEFASRGSDQSNHRERVHHRRESEYPSPSKPSLDASNYLSKAADAAGSVHESVDLTGEIDKGSKVVNTESNEVGKEPIGQPRRDAEVGTPGSKHRPRLQPMRKRPIYEIEVEIDVKEQRKPNDLDSVAPPKAQESSAANHSEIVSNTDDPIIVVAPSSTDAQKRIYAESSKPLGESTPKSGAEKSKSQNVTSPRNSVVETSRVKSSDAVPLKTRTPHSTDQQRHQPQNRMKPREVTLPVGESLQKRDDPVTMRSTPAATVGLTRTIKSASSARERTPLVSMQSLDLAIVDDSDPIAQYETVDPKGLKTQHGPRKSHSKQEVKNGNKRPRYVLSEDVSYRMDLPLYTKRRFHALWKGKFPKVDYSSDAGNASQSLTSNTPLHSSSGAPHARVTSRLSTKSTSTQGSHPPVVSESAQRRRLSSKSDVVVDIEGDVTDDDPLTAPWEESPRKLVVSGRTALPLGMPPQPVAVPVALLSNDGSQMALEANAPSKILQGSLPSKRDIQPNTASTEQAASADVALDSTRRLKRPHQEDFVVEIDTIPLKRLRSSSSRQSTLGGDYEESFEPNKNDTLSSNKLVHVEQSVTSPALVDSEPVAPLVQPSAVVPFIGIPRERSPENSFIVQHPSSQERWAYSPSRLKFPVGVPEAQLIWNSEASSLANSGRRGCWVLPRAGRSTWDEVAHAIVEGKLPGCNACWESDEIYVYTNLDHAARVRTLIGKYVGGGKYIPKAADATNEQILAFRINEDVVCAS